MTHVHARSHGGDAAARNEARLKAWWPFLAANLPDPPATAVEIGCGPVGGFVPAMIEAGYDAIGVDPEAPEGPPYYRTTFEEHSLAQPVDAVVACTSLHHVADLHVVAERIAGALQSRGTLVVLEWAWERFDEATVQWCLAQLPNSAEDDAGWLVHHQRDWEASGLPWEVYLLRWATAEGLHTGSDQLDALRSSFQTVSASVAPYFFADLDGVDADTEQSTIDSGLIQPTGIRYVGRALG